MDGLTAWLLAGVVCYWLMWLAFHAYRYQPIVPRAGTLGWMVVWMMVPPLSLLITAILVGLIVADELGKRS